MILVEKIDENSGVSVVELIQYNEQATIDAVEKFDKLKEEGIIKNDNFNDTVWKVNNGYVTVCYKFDFDSILYKKESKNRNMYKYSEFLNCVKSYIITRFNDKISRTMSNCINKLRKLMEVTHYLNVNYKEHRLDAFNLEPQSADITEISMINDFLNYIYIQGIDVYRELFEEDLERLNIKVSNYSKNSELNRRNLPDYQSVFLFDRLINQFWKSELTTTERAYYYPLYLWWRVTNILPLRPKEFLITPYECISKKNDKYSIAIRRSDIKGRGLKKITHSIEGDYKLYSYPVSKEIAELILDYKRITEEYREIDGRQLLISNTLYREKGKFRTELDKEYISESDKIFTLPSLKNMLNNFYVNIIQKKNGFSIIDINYLENKKQSSDFISLNENEITLIKPGDTRHFALINLVLNDFSPILVKDFAGHMRVDTSYHYFGNIDQLVKCVSYTKYKELCEYKVNDVVYNVQNITANKVMNSMDSNNVFSIELDNGKCKSVKFSKSDVSDCQTVAGECEVCDFFIKTYKETREERISRLKLLQSEIRHEGKLLGTLLATYKDDIKDDKLIEESIIRLQSKTARYIQNVTMNGVNVYD